MSSRHKKHDYMLLIKAEQTGAGVLLWLSPATKAASGFSFPESQTYIESAAASVQMFSVLCFSNKQQNDSETRFFILAELLRGRILVMVLMLKVPCEVFDH